MRTVSDNCQISLENKTGFQEAMYTANGTHPVYNESKPFTIQVLENIIHGIRDLDIFTIDDYYIYTPFTNRFEAWCAGVFCELGILVPADYCYEDFSEILGDYNIDVAT